MAGVGSDFCSSFRNARVRGKQEMPELWTWLFKGTKLSIHPSTHQWGGGGGVSQVLRCCATIGPGEQL